MTSFGDDLKYNTDSSHPLRGIPVSAPERVSRYFNDFIKETDFVTGNWVTTNVGSAAAISIVNTAVNGNLLITTGTVDADSRNLQHGDSTNVSEIWALTSGKRAAFSAKFKISDATDAALLIGLAITDTTAIAGTTDGLYFRKADASTSLLLVSEKDSVEDTITLATMADDTMVEVAFSYDGVSTVSAHLKNSDGVWQLKGSTTAIPDDEELAITLAVTNGATGAETIEIDYLDVVQER
tara:strand:- start:237 stop:953 length:717 start_codon:yes stop_codon:yes gene_type:complete